MSSNITYLATAEDAGQRIDAMLASRVGTKENGLTRSYIQKLIIDGAITRNGAPLKSGAKAVRGDLFEITVPDPVDPAAKPEDIPIDIVYEDADIIVINKARGMVVHPADGNPDGTLVNALLHHCADLSDINGVKRPGIVHRIDKDTTGLLVVAKNNAAHESLAEQIKEHKVSRVYTALVEGVIKEDSGKIDAPVGRHPVDRKRMAVNVKNGRGAVTYFTVMKRYSDCTLVKCRLETGRTHQIRVHMAYIGHPVACDPVYGIKKDRGLAGQALHAGELTLTHPRTGRLMTFTAPLPEDFQKLLDMVK